MQLQKLLQIYETIWNFCKCYQKVCNYKYCCKRISLYQTFIGATKKYATTIFVAKYEFIPNFCKCYQKVCNYKNCCKLKLFSYGCSQPFKVSKPFRFAPRFNEWSCNLPWNPMWYQSAVDSHLDYQRLK